MLKLHGLSSSFEPSATYTLAPRPAFLERSLETDQIDVLEGTLKQDSSVGEEVAAVLVGNASLVVVVGSATDPLIIPQLAENVDMV
jgi:hypothetical protein